MSSPTADPADRFSSAKPAGLTADIIARRQRLQAQWRRHSSLIHDLRRVLPGLALLLLGFLAVWAIGGTVAGRLAAQRQSGNLTIRMLKPNFQGRDENGKPYRLSADSAVRDDVDSARVTLDAPVFSLGSAQQGQTYLHAQHGVYREDSRVLDITGQVHLQDDSGMHFVTEHAVIDLKTNNVDGDTHIEGSGPLGRIAASSYAVRNAGEQIFFAGHVKARIEHSGAPSGAQPAPANR